MNNVRRRYNPLAAPKPTTWLNVIVRVPKLKSLGLGGRLRTSQQRRVLVVYSLLLAALCMAASTQDERFVIFQNGHHGYISDTGKVVIEPILEGTFVLPFHEGMAEFAEEVLPKPTKYPFVDDQGRVHVSRWHRWGFIDTTGKKVVPARYDSVQPFSEGLAAIAITTDQTRYDCLHCQPNLLWGFIRRDGEVAIKPQFSGAGNFSEGMAAVENCEGRWGFIDKNGNLAVGYRFRYPSDYSEGLAAVSLNERFGFIDKTGRLVIEPRFAEAGRFSNGLAPVRNGGKTKTGDMILGKVGGRWEYVDSTGSVKITLPHAAEDARPFAEGRAAVHLKGKCGYIDSSGAMVVKPEYDSCDDFSEGVAVVRADGRFQFIDLSGKVILILAHEYFQVSAFHNGLASVTVGEVGPNQRFGYINKQGVEIWEPQPAL